MIYYICCLCIRIHYNWVYLFKLWLVLVILKIILINNYCYIITFSLTFIILTYSCVFLSFYAYWIVLYFEKPKQHIVLFQLTFNIVFSQLIKHFGTKQNAQSWAPVWSFFKKKPWVPWHCHVYCWNLHEMKIRWVLLGYILLLFVYVHNYRL
jgi:hypothetical protein